MPNKKLSKRPHFITNDDIDRWFNILKQDTTIPKAFFNSPELREVCYAGLFLSEELEKLNCPPSIICRIQYTAGSLSFGRDVWEVHQKVLEEYNNNSLIFEGDDAIVKN